MVWKRRCAELSTRRSTRCAPIRAVWMSLFLCSSPTRSLHYCPCLELRCWLMLADEVACSVRGAGVRDVLSLRDYRGATGTTSWSCVCWERLSHCEPKISASKRRKGEWTAKIRGRYGRSLAPTAIRQLGCNMHATDGRACRPFHRLQPLCSSHAFCSSAVEEQSRAGSILHQI